MWVRVSKTEDLADVTLADEDTNWILTDNANTAIQGNVAMQVMRPGAQLWKQCKRWLMMTKFRIASQEIDQTKRTPSFLCTSAGLALSSLRTQFLGPLCLWQCLGGGAQRSSSYFDFLFPYLMLLVSNRFDSVDSWSFELRLPPFNSLSF